MPDSIILAVRMPILLETKQMVRKIREIELIIHVFFTIYFPGTREVRAVAKIKMNEEICINYGGMHMRNFPNRQKFLSSVYGFKCVCELCEREIMADEMKHFLETNFANDDGR